MTLYYAQPYNMAVEGFYFQCAEEFHKLVAKVTDSFGQPVEEFEIQFIDGGQLPCELFEAWKPGQSEVARFIDACEDWWEDSFLMAIIAMRDLGYRPTDVVDDPDALDITLYRTDSLKDLAHDFVEEGLFGEIADNVQCYLDHEAIARDLAIDGYTETIVAGERLIYRAG